LSSLFGYYLLFTFLIYCFILESVQDKIRKITLNKWQSKVWSDDHRYIVLNCGRRAGKSVYSALKIASFVQKSPNSIVYYVSPTYLQSKSIMWNMLRSYIPSHWIKKENESALTIDCVNGSKIELKGADTAPDRLRGVRIDYLVCDEVAYFKNWSNVWNKVLRPTLLDSKGKALFISSPQGYNHFYDMFNMGKDDNKKEWSSYRFTTYDNEYIDSGEIDKIKHEMDEDSFLQEHCAEFKRYRGMVFKYFARDKHYIQAIDFPPSTTFYRGIDFGWASPSAVVFCAVVPEGKLYVYDLIYGSHITTPDLVILMKQKSVGRSFAGTWADSSQAADIAEMNNYGISVSSVSKSVTKTGTSSENFVKYKTRKMNQLIKSEKFYIFNHLDKALFEMENYQYKEVHEDGVIKERPMKLHDHFIDAVSYVVVNLPSYYEPSLVETEETRIEIPDWVNKSPSWSGLKFKV